MLRIQRLLWCYFMWGGASLCCAQTSPDTYWVAFTDKDATPYSLQTPEAFLSPRAIQRRLAQGIALDEMDLPVDPAYVAQVETVEGAEVLNRSKWLNGVVVQVLDSTVRDAILELPCVATVHMVGSGARVLDRPDKFGTPRTVADRELDTVLYGNAYRQLRMLNGQALHALGARGNGMLIGVLDSGFDGVDSSLAFAPLRTRGGILGTRDLVAHDGDVFADHWHGRSVLSCMAAVLDSHLIGTAPDADYVLIRTEEVASEFPVEEDTWISGAEWADSLGCDVLNTSLGYTAFDDSTMDHTYGQLDGQTLRVSIAAGIASRKGMVPVFSAGNSGSSEWFHISAPADAIDVLTVGAVGDSMQYAPFSSHGPSADGRVKPDVCVMGWGTTVLNVGVDSVVQANGTSFASPVLAGLVACLWQLHPERSASSIMDAVRRSATLFNEPNDSLGYGIPDFGSAHAWLLLTSTPTTHAASTTKVWPQPFVGTVNVQDSRLHSAPVHAALFDGAGRLERAWRAAALEHGVIQLSGLETLAPGTHMLRLVQEELRIDLPILRAP